MSGTESSDYKEVSLDDQKYTIRLMPTMSGLNFITKLQKDGMTGELVFEAISKCAAIGSTTFTEKKFNSHFKGKYAHLMRLVEEIIQFNFPDMEDNEEGGKEEGDTDDQAE